MMKPHTVEVVSHLATELGNCAHCELMLNEAGVKIRARDQDTADYPADLKEEMVKRNCWTPA